jgi:Na+(H+)/acetate symporter ActP
VSTAYGVAAVGLVIVATVLIGSFALRLSRTTSDFYVASRSVSPAWNASAIGGEYLSAASFLGIAGLILAYGADMLWFPVGYTAGYLVLLVLVAAPLRRSGAYTLPDFAEARTESRTVRRIASILVVTIGWLYLLPQLLGAGLTVSLATGAPEWVGGLLIAAVVVFSVATGGMRSITFVQAFQYWLKLTALAVPVLFLVLAWRADGGPTPGAGPATFPDRTAVHITRDTGFVVTDPVQVHADGQLTAPSTGITTSYAGQRVTLRPGTWRAIAPATLTFPAGAVVPHATSLEPSDGDEWARPLSGAGGRDHPLYATYSLILALFFGTMGLPHVLVRFYTNPDGRAARRTTLVVLALLGGFYLLPTIYGALARVYTPDLLLTGRTDTAVLLLPDGWSAAPSASCSRRS